MRLIALPALLVAAVCACASDPDPVVVYCQVVEDTASAMAGTDPSVKRPAMFELRDAAPDELRGYWDAYVAAETELAERDLARERIGAFEAEHCRPNF